MEISAFVRNTPQRHEAVVATGGNERTLALPAKASGAGSEVNGGELLLLALATCYCNDLYREAARLGIALDGAEVHASALFEGIGLAASDIRYRAKVSSSASAEQIAALLRETDAVAEVHNTVRAGVPVVPARERRASALERQPATRGGATSAPSTPCRRSASATNPDAFISSMNALSHACAATRPFGTAIACSITMKRPGNRRTPPTRRASASSCCLTPAATSRFWARKRSVTAGDVGARTSVADFNSRVRKRS